MKAQSQPFQVCNAAVVRATGFIGALLIENLCKPASLQHLCASQHSSDRDRRIKAIASPSRSSALSLLVSVCQEERPLILHWRDGTCPAVQVRRALPKTPKQEAVGDDPCTLYVRGLEADVDQDRLEAIFQVLPISKLPPAIRA